MDYPENRLEGNIQQKNANLDLNRFHTANQQQKTGELMLENAACELQELEESDSVQLFQRQVELLKRRLLNNPGAFQQIFMEEGMQAVAWEFQQDELSLEFTETLWKLLLRDDEMSKILLRFVWDIPLKFKRRLIRALDKHLSGRYPMFQGLSQNWPGENHIPPYIRPAAERTTDFDLVNQGYLGYMGLGYSFREIELLVWLEVLRDKQCEDRPCEIGLIREGQTENEGGCPVKIHIPEMLRLIGEGRFQDAFELMQSANPLPNVTGRVCPQEIQCQGVCTSIEPIEIGQIEWFLPESQVLREKDLNLDSESSIQDPWIVAEKPPVAVIGSGPAGLINAFLLLDAGYPVTVFEAFHELGGVLRYGIPEFRLPNRLIDHVVERIRERGGRFVKNFIAGKTATLDQLKEAGFWKIFVGTGAGLPRFLNVPGEHLLGVMSANEFLTRVNLMQANLEDHETPLPETKGKQVIVIGGGNTAMDAARTALRLGGEVTIVYRRTREEMPVRKEELEHALEEGIQVKYLRTPREFIGSSKTHFVREAILDVMELGEPDASGRRRPVVTGNTETMTVHLAIMALGNSPNPIVKDAEPELKTTRWGTIEVDTQSQRTSIQNVYSGGDAARGGSTAIKAAGDGQNAAHEIIGGVPYKRNEVRERVGKALAYTEQALAPAEILEKTELAEGIVEFRVHAPLIARAALAGQFVRVLLSQDGEFIPLTLADWDVRQGNIDLVIQGVGTSTKLMNQLEPQQSFAGIAGPLGRPSVIERYDDDRRVVFIAGGVGLPPVLPILKEHLELGNQTVLISGFRNLNQAFWHEPGQRLDRLQSDFPNLEVIYTSDDGSFGLHGLVTQPLETMLKQANTLGPGIGEVIAIGPPLMMRAVSELTRPYGVKTIASLNSVMIDATGMCGACMVPIHKEDQLLRKHACVDGPEFDAHSIDWEKLLPRFKQFNLQELRSQELKGLS